MLKTGPIETISDLETLIRRWAHHWEVAVPLSRADVEAMFASRGFSPELNTRAYWTGSDLIAFGLVKGADPAANLGRVAIFGLVDPSHRHHGIGRSLLAWQVERAAELLVETTPGESREIKVIGDAGVDEHSRLYLRYGFRRRRATSHSEHPVYVLILP